MGTIVVWLLGIMLAGLAAAESAAMGRMGDGWHGMHDGSAERRQYVMRQGIGSGYASLGNPLARTGENLRQGGQIYRQACIACHGEDGRGDTAAAASLDPPPANLAATVRMPIATDGYLFWAIAEGGIPIGTGMPAFKDALSERETWQLILYLRTLR